jgi:hypothetical protein
VIGTRRDRADNLRRELVVVVAEYPRSWNPSRICAPEISMRGSSRASLTFFRKLHAAEIPAHRACPRTCGYPFLTSGHSPLSIGRNASSPGIVRTSL